MSIQEINRKLFLMIYDCVLEPDRHWFYCMVLPIQWNIIISIMQ